ncbi:hypothetical protein [Lentibacillus sp.]|nr:hypothetical protein [Lentibacillus sp.]HLS09364.1 hypothetical protein [Lentibacillus sp.]
MTKEIPFGSDVTSISTSGNFSVNNGADAVTNSVPLRMTTSYL